MPGTIIFFDWEQDGNIDHVGIVKYCDVEQQKVITLEGNSSDRCKENTYDINSASICGRLCIKYAYCIEYKSLTYKFNVYGLGVFLFINFQN